MSRQLLGDRERDTGLPVARIYDLRYGGPGGEE
jgi:hypothetical protein